MTKQRFARSVGCHVAQSINSTRHCSRSIANCLSQTPTDCATRNRAMAPVCPKCDVRLLIVHLQEIAVDFCDRCRGVWLDAGELEELMTRTGARPDEAFRHALGVSPAPSRLTHALCPRCDQPM